MTKTRKLGKWIYSGTLGVALTAAGLSTQMREPWVDSSVTVTKIEKKPARVEEKSPWSDLSASAKELEQALSWNEIRRFPSAAYRDFIQQLAQEEFDNGQPFQLEPQRELWTTVLENGLKDYTRKVYRSPYFKSGSGYDLVYYELLLGNSKKAILLAFREKTAENQLAIGEEDQRPTRIDFYLESSDSDWTLSSYKTSGEKIIEKSLSEEQSVASREAIVSLSVPLLTAGK